MSIRRMTACVPIAQRGLNDGSVLCYTVLEVVMTEILNGVAGGFAILAVTACITVSALLLVEIVFSVVRKWGSRHE